VLEEIPVSLLFKDVIIGFKDLDGVAHFFQAKIIEDLLYNKEPALSSDQNKALYLDFCLRNPQLKRKSMEFKHALKTDPYFNALRLKFGYAITCHKAQGSEWNNVFVKCKSHQSQLTADYFRWFYTAITRTAKILYLLDPPDLQPWSGIEIVSTPGLGLLGAEGTLEVYPSASVTASSPLTSVPAAQKDETFGIPKSATFLLSILAEVRKLIDGKGIIIENVSHNQYQEAYYFTREAESTRIDISYNSKNKIVGVVNRNLSGLTDEVTSLLLPLKGKLLFPESGSAIAEASFSKTFLNDFHHKVIGLCTASGITVQNVIEQQWSLRYSFVRDGAVAVYDVWYNGRDQITRCQPVITACSPGPLTSSIGQLLTEGMRA